MQPKQTLHFSQFCFLDSYALTVPASAQHEYFVHLSWATFRECFQAKKDICVAKQIDDYYYCFIIIFK